MTLCFSSDVKLLKACEILSLSRIRAVIKDASIFWQFQYADYTGFYGLH